jgi:hypothetical protein
VVIYFIIKKFLNSRLFSKAAMVLPVAVWLPKIIITVLY